MKVIDWASNESGEFASRLLKDQIIAMCNRAVRNIPHFLILPYSEEYSLAGKYLKIIISIWGSTDYFQYGLQYSVFISFVKWLLKYNRQNDNFFSEKTPFQISPYPSSQNLLSSLLEFFSLRNSAKTYAILSPNYGEAHKLGMEAFEQISTFTNTTVSLVMKRCQSSVYHWL